MDEIVALQLTCGMAARRLISLPAAARAACQSRVIAPLASLADADRVHRPEVLLAVAVTPA